MQALEKIFKRVKDGEPVWIREHISTDGVLHCYPDLEAAVNCCDTGEVLYKACLKNGNLVIEGGDDLPVVISPPTTTHSSRLLPSEEGGSVGSEAGERGKDSGAFNIAGHMNFRPVFNGSDCKITIQNFGAPYQSLNNNTDDE